MTFFIGEIGVNHENNIDNALKMIDDLSYAKWDAAKFQSYKANKLAREKSPSYWDTSKEKIKSQHELFSKFDNWNFEEYKYLHKYCEKKGIEFMTTAFDLDTLDDIDILVKRHKISSSDITNFQLIDAVAKKGKPIILSTGASKLDEIKRAVSWIKAVNDKPLCLLHCVLRYPTEIKYANIGRINALTESGLAESYGYSDHTVPPSSFEAIKTSITLGAKVIEKHFTYNKELPGNDHYHAFDRGDALRMIELTDFQNELIGNSQFDVSGEESARDNARRSITSIRKILKGEILTPKNITSKRPLKGGICASQWEHFIGKKVNKDINLDEPILFSDLENA